jgi:transposase-like protein
MARGRRHSDEIRAAVLAALLAGQGVNETARKYKLDTGLVSRWKKTLAPAALQRIQQKSPDEFDELFTSLLRANLETLRFLADWIRSTEGVAWLKDQSGAEFATLYGVTFDKTVRLCEADQAAKQQEQPAIDVEAAPAAPDPV